MISILTVTFFIINLFLFTFVAQISGLELGCKLALYHVSFEHILAVIEGATDGAFKGPIFKQYKFKS